MLDNSNIPLISNHEAIVMKNRRSVNDMLLKIYNKSVTKIVSNFKESMILRTTPPAIISIILSLIPIFGGDSYTQYAGITMLTQLNGLGTITALVGAYLVCILIGFKKDFDGYWHWSRKKRLIHRISFIVLAIISAIVPYLASTAMFFFNVVDNDYEILTIEHKIALMVYLGFYSFSSTDMFSGFLGKGLFFKIPQINRSPLKKYSTLEGKMRKYFPNKINKILAMYD